jgi:serine O-acetyltransferase
MQAPLTRAPQLPNRAALRAVIAEDLRAHGVDRYRRYYRFTHRTIYFQVLLRHAEYWDGCGRLCAVLIAPLFRLRAVRLGELLGFTVPMHVTGPGFSIAHAGTVTISHLASVGRNCRIHTDVCIGEVEEAAPVIGDNVWIGPGAKIFGPVTVGDGAVIGANAVVLEDVPAGATVGGIPARVVSCRDSAHLMAVVTSTNAFPNANYAVVPTRRLSGSVCAPSLC